MRPVSSKFRISQSYGKPGDYAAGFHTGTDFACPVGTPVKAPFRGTVTIAWEAGGDYGHYVLITGLGGKRAWLLAHLSEIDVRRGQHVDAGQVIGKSGNTGNSTGPHLHAEERHPPFGYHDTQVPTAWRDPGAKDHS
jgi:murein DD-endopeptidase MepM/ murein hydrolase activator NlpD